MIEDLTGVPDFVTHYHLPDRRPFLNLSELDDEQVPVVLAELDEAAVSGRSARHFGPRYMALRRETERIMRARFIARGGRPVRNSPHYFVLGESAWFRGRYGLPRSPAPADYDGHQFKEFEHYLEVQLWTDAPLAAAVPDW